MSEKRLPVPASQLDTLVEAVEGAERPIAGAEGVLRGLLESRWDLGEHERRRWMEYADGLKQLRSVLHSLGGERQRERDG